MRRATGNFHYRLLFIDDDPSSRELFQAALSAKGYEVCVAQDGFAALAQMRGALPDLIVSDLKM
jgi:two-component system response regulator TctD